MTASLVVGAGGFVGRRLHAWLEAAGEPAAVVSTHPELSSWQGLRLLEPDTGVIESALAGIERIYFVGGAAHEAAAGSEDALKAVNVDAPLRWLEAADRAGVGRFVWLSSIKVLGDVSLRPLVPDDPYRPADAYARSKMEGERALLGHAGTTKVAVVRPPLVYGPHVGANFARLLHWADSAVPLPLGRADAPRSLVAVDNLCDLLCRLGHRGSGVFHVADDDGVSVAELLRELRALLGRPPRLVRVPPPLMRMLGRLAGREGLYQRLFEPLQVDFSATCSILDWSPPRSRRQALEETVTWFRTSR